MKKVLQHSFAAVVLASSMTTMTFAADLKLGFITSLSGPSASLGIPYAKGLQAGIAYAPTVNGQKVDVVQLDDASDPTTAARNARKLIEEDKVDALIGTSGTPSGLAMNGVAREYGVPFISIAQAKVDGDDGKWMVTVPQPAPLMIDSVVDYMHAHGVKTVGYIGFSDAWGDIVYDALQQAAKRTGIQIVDNQRYGRLDNSVTGQIIKILAKKPDAVLTGTSGTPGALPYLALKDRGYKGQIYGTHGIINPDFLRIGGASVEGMIAPTGPVMVADQLPDTNASKQISLKFRAAYEKVNHQAPNDAFAPYAFDAWLIFINAADRALKVNKQPGTAPFRTALLNAIVSTKELAGTQGVYNFTPDSRFGVDKRATVLVKVKDGKWQYVPE